MRKNITALTLAMACTLLTGCSTVESVVEDYLPRSTSENTESSSSDTESLEPPVENTAPNPAVDYMPVTAQGRTAWNECPYLNTEWVQDANGQKVTGMDIDPSLNPPACVFWSFPEEPQLTVMVRHFSDPKDAIAMVDWAAPIDTTDPAQVPGGWDGGRFGGEGRSLFAVHKGNTAVVVFSNQEQSVKAQIVAEEVIKNLKL